LSQKQLLFSFSIQKIPFFKLDCKKFFRTSKIKIFIKEHLNILSGKFHFQNKQKEISRWLSKREKILAKKRQIERFENFCMFQQHKGDQAKHFAF
jgi:hypothetical protein